MTCQTRVYARVQKTVPLRRSKTWIAEAACRVQAVKHINDAVSTGGALAEVTAVGLNRQSGRRRVRLGYQRRLAGKISIVSSLKPIPITAANFARFGWLASGENLTTAQSRPINGGTSLRLDECGELSLTAEGGQACLALFRAQARDLTQPFVTLERHRLGTQTFIPMGGVCYVMLVAHGDTEPGVASLAAFIARGDQAVTLRADTWHHGLIAL
jgi:ureidoglycolate lyase